MLTLKDYAGILGVGLICIGAFCLPVGAGASPKRDLSAFFRLADTGALLTPGVLIIAAGLFVLLLAWLLPLLTATFRRLTRRSSERRGGVGP